MDITPGATYQVTFPRGMHKSDFGKCLGMARKLGTFDTASSAWTIAVAGLHGAASVRQMAERGATVTEA